MIASNRLHTTPNHDAGGAPPPAEQPLPPGLLPLLVDSSTAARLLGISERSLWTLTDSGEVPCVYPVARCKRYSVEGLKQYVARLQRDAEAQAGADRERDAEEGGRPCA
jgi:hypothetical protein